MAASPGRSIRLAALGLALARQDRGFHPRNHGHSKLLHLVRALDVGTLAVDDSGIHWTLTALETDGQAPASGPPVVDLGVRVDPTWWRAVTGPPTEPAVYFDLGAESLCIDATAVAAEPERYVPLPRLEAASLERPPPGFVEDATGHRVPSETAEPEVGSPRTQRLMGAELRIAVVETLDAWSGRHGVERRRWVAKNVPALAPVARRLRSAGSKTADADPAPRALVQAWLDGCSDTELGAIVASLGPVERLLRSLRVSDPPEADR